MADVESTRAILNNLVVPELERDLESLNLIKELNVTDEEITLTLATTALNENVQSRISELIGQTLSTTKKKIAVNYVEAAATEQNSVAHVVAVMSGKGGVGKSLVTGLCAVALKRQGFRVGILDADITGPSIPHMFGVSGAPTGSASGILPVISGSGIEIISANLMLSNEDDAIVWRGPLISGAIKQFWEQVLWGKLDYLLVDLPPGTADAPLTVMQTLPIDGAVIVFTPQDLVEMIVRKAVSMAKKMNKPVLGLVENMSYLEVPELGKRLEPFGHPRGEAMAKKVNAPLLAQLPIDAAIARYCDEGKIEDYNSELVTKMGQELVGVTAKIQPART